MDELTFIVEGPLPAGLRIDKYISENMKFVSRSQLKERVKEVYVNEKKVKFSYRVRPEDSVRIHYIEEIPSELMPEPVPLDIIYEDENVIVINKNQGLVVHPGAGHYTGTLVHGLLYYCKTLKAQFEDFPLRPGIVHRLDKDTSGVIITAKNGFAHKFLSEQFRDRLAAKEYLAIIKGKPPLSKGKIDRNIKRDPNHRKRFLGCDTGGKPSLTRYEVLKTFDNHCFVKLKPATGRTHQLRVHMTDLQCPILGDPIYTRKDYFYPDSTLMLHAYKLSICLPGEKEQRTFCAPLAPRFIELFQSIGYEPENL